MTLRLQTTHNAILSVGADVTLGLFLTFLNVIPEESVILCVGQYCNLNMIGLYLIVSLCAV